MSAPLRQTARTNNVIDPLVHFLNNNSIPYDLHTDPLLIIPDLHTHTENADHWLRTETYGRAVFLGDYFDDYDDDAQLARETAGWVRNRVETTGDVFLLGNHDAAYLFPKDERLFCPGFTDAKARAIRGVLQKKHWSRFRLCHAHDDWLISHAGFHPTWIEPPTRDTIVERCEKAMRLASRGIVDPILGMGEKPGGIQRYGGPLWMDWNALVPIPGLHQIVGHTSDEMVREKHTFRSQNYCLDVRNGMAAALLEKGNLKILEKA